VARIPLVTRESIPANQRDVFDTLMRDRSDGFAGGPLSVMIHVPEMMRRGEHLRAYLRGEDSSLPLEIRELAMILTAREMDCQYIWNAHAAMARKAGIRDDVVDALRERRELTGLSPAEAAVVNYGREFFRTHKVGQATFDAALSQFGVRGLVELTNLMGYYALLAFNVNAFGAELPMEVSEAPLPV
jgi:4-carboxymuconolactone decarboxylase